MTPIAWPTGFADKTTGNEKKHIKNAHLTALKVLNICVAFANDKPNMTSKSDSHSEMVPVGVDLQNHSPVLLLRQRYRILHTSWLLSWWFLAVSVALTCRCSCLFPLSSSSLHSSEPFYRLISCPYFRYSYLFGGLALLLWGFQLTFLGVSAYLFGGLKWP